MIGDPLQYNSGIAQARRQDSVTGGAEINFGGAREVYLCEFERGTGARFLKFFTNS